MQIRLLMIVAILLGAAALGEAALDGRFSSSSASDAASAPPKVETRLPAPPLRTPEDLHLITTEPNHSPFSQEKVDATAQVVPLVELEEDFWNRLYSSLTVPQQDHLLVLLRYALRDAAAPLGTSDRAALLRKLEESAAAYETAAAKDLAASPDITPQRREAFTAALQSVMQNWRTTLAPLIAKLCRQEPLSPEDQTPLRELAALWTELARRQVHDDASSPAKDFVYWFYLVDELRHNPDALAGAASPSYAELFDQAAQWRGKPVAVAGVIELAEYQQARPNHYGIEGYFVLWIRPDNYRDAPLRVFALRAPQDAAAPVDASNLAPLVGRPCRLEGLYFKRMAYRAQDNIRAVPTLLADQVDLLAAPAAAQSTADRLSLFMLGLLVIILVAVAAAIFLFTSGGRRHSLPDKIELPPAPPQPRPEERSQ